MKISFIIPTYKSNLFLEECVNSVLQLEGVFDREILIIHNGLDNDYYEQLKEAYETIIDVFIYSVYDKGGVCTARNLGIDQSTGEFIVFLDDDDLLSSNFISESLLVDSSISERTLLISNLVTFKDSVNEVERDYVSYGIEKLKSVEGVNIFNFRKLMSSACFKIYSRDIIDNVRFNENLKVSEDALFVFELSNNITYFKVIENIFYYRRIRKDSVSNKKKSLSESFSIFYKFSLNLTKVFFGGRNYSFLFYVNRLLASLKFFILNSIK